MISKAAVIISLEELIELGYTNQTQIAFNAIPLLLQEDVDLFVVSSMPTLLHWFILSKAKPFLGDYGVLLTRGTGPDYTYLARREAYEVIRPHYKRIYVLCKDKFERGFYNKQDSTTIGSILMSLNK